MLVIRVAKPSQRVTRQPLVSVLRLMSHMAALLGAAATLGPGKAMGSPAACLLQPAFPSDPNYLLHLHQLPYVQGTWRGTEVAVKRFLEQNLSPQLVQVGGCDLQCCPACDPRALNPAVRAPPMFPLPSMHHAHTRGRSHAHTPCIAIPSCTPPPHPAPPPVTPNRLRHPLGVQG